MRSSRIAALPVAVLAAASAVAATGCGGLSDDDRNEIAGVVRDHLVADRRGDDAAFCRTLTRELQTAYATDPERPEDESAEPSGCAKGHARLRIEVDRMRSTRTPDPTNAKNSAAIADALRRTRGREADLARAARDPANVTVEEEDDRVLVTVRGERFEDQSVVERDDGRWRIAPGPETATLR